MTLKKNSRKILNIFSFLKKKFFYESCFAKNVSLFDFLSSNHIRIDIFELNYLCIHSYYFSILKINNFFYKGKICNFRFANIDPVSEILIFGLKLDNITVLDQKRLAYLFVIVYMSSLSINIEKFSFKDDSLSSFVSGMFACYFRWVG